MLHADYIIVGAGISGLTSALTILNDDPNAKLLVVDSADRVGGLLRSEQFDGVEFDFGTHIPEQTSYEELNNLLFSFDNANLWHKLPALTVGNYFANRLNEHSQFPDLTTDAALGEKVLSELLNLSGEAWRGGNLQSYVTHHYGATVAADVLSPLMYKFANRDLAELSQQALKYYGLSRLICADREKSIALKQAEHLDRVLAFKHDAEKPRKSFWYYPSQQRGIGFWVDALQHKISAAGGLFELGRFIQKLQGEAGAYQVTLSNGEDYSAKQLIWTIPVYRGLHQVQQSRPCSRAISIFHFTADQAPLTRCHYIYCYDAKLASYRLTLYSNLQDVNEASCHRCSVEVIHDEGGAPAPEQILAELKLMQIFAGNSAVRFIGTSALPVGFPVPLVGTDEQRQQLFSQVCHHNPGVIFLGRARPELFFMTDVLVDSYLKSKQLVQEGTILT